MPGAAPACALSRVGESVSSTGEPAPALTPLTPLELATSLIFGDDKGSVGLQAEAGSPRGALEEAVLAALRRPPCVVSFSGGRDSSSVLAVAALVARREGLDEPVPVSLSFPAVESSHETEWQEQVVRHLGLNHWERAVLGNEVETLGPVAVKQLLRHGVLWPFNTHFHHPIFERARGGTVMTGIGGDELLTPSDWIRVNRVVAREVRPRPKDALRLALAYGPRAVRTRWLMRDRDALAMPWLRPPAQRELVRRYAVSYAEEPIGHGAWILGSWWRNRARLIGNQSLERLAGEVGAAMVHPLQDRRFLARLAKERHQAGYTSRTQAMRHLFGDVLPAPVLSRATKAYFDDMFWGERTRGFADTWDGTGAPGIVDPTALNAMWRGEHGPVDCRSLLLLQSVWLAAQPRPA